MQFRATRCASGRFAMTYCDYGCTSYGGAANGADGHGSASKRASASSSRRSESYILIPAYALPPPIQGRNRVRQSRQHGSVRGGTGQPISLPRPPRIHGELLKLGIDIGETSVAKYMARG